MKLSDRDGGNISCGQLRKIYYYWHLQGVQAIKCHQFFFMSPMLLGQGIRIPVRSSFLLIVKFSTTKDKYS